MLSKTFFLIASAALALATPLPATAPGAGCPSTKPQPVLPTNGGPKELESPPAGTKLKAIVLGFGIQNYTCSSEAGAKPVATGALAMLYDVTSLYPGQSSKSLSLESFNALTTTALWNNDVPLNFGPVTDDRIAGSKPASATKPFTKDAPLKLKGLSPIPFAGHHFFNAEGKPAFVVKKNTGSTGKTGITYIAEKKDGIDAPAGADRGPEGTGAVGWLYLGPVAGTTGAQYLYRVLTAGGVSHGCSSGPGADSVSYTTTYWFYG
ncbi:hypothetical protein HJFPF1_04656 [Paramyrothecium foliicola]|nr:hypothetical protein HJFPF1_04656 [Paramyrothecium foliicola]